MFFRKLQMSHESDGISTNETMSPLEAKSNRHVGSMILGVNQDGNSAYECMLENEEAFIDHLVMRMIILHISIILKHPTILSLPASIREGETMGSSNENDGDGADEH